MNTDHGLGIALALGAWVLWSLSPFFFTSTGRRIGPFATNLARLLLASGMLALLCALQGVFWPGTPLPGAGAWILLLLSGVVGLVVGDLFLYRSFFHVGPERTSLLMTLSPVAAAALAWIFLKERLSPEQLGGMALVLGGVAVTTWPKKFPAHGMKGGWSEAWNGIFSALCQGTGTVLARQAFLREGNLSPLFATSIRVGGSALVIALIAFASGRLGLALRKTREPAVARRLLGGTVVGPVLGMLCYIASLKHLSAGIVTTITFMTPLLVIPLGAWKYKARFSGRTLAGGMAALAGVILLGWNT